MFAHRWQLFRLCGIPISLDVSWLVILALLTITIAGSFPLMMHEYYGAATPILPPYQSAIIGFIAAIAFFACIVLHELGHAVVARARGMTISGVTLFLFGGVAELAGEPPSAATEFLMAIAGPAVSLVLGIVFGLSAWIGYHGGWAPPVVTVLGYLGFINLLVLAFNLVPAFPLDGGRVLRSILWGATGNLRRATRWASLAGQTFAWFLIAWGIFQFFMGNWLGGIWSGLIGMFLNGAAQSGYRSVLIRNALRGEPVRRFMNPAPIVVPQSLDLRHWVEDYVYPFHHHGFPVTSNGDLEGFINTRTLAQMPRDEWNRHTIGEVMQRDCGPITVAPNSDALDAMSTMQSTGSSQLLVVNQDHLVGIISSKDLLRFLHLKMELEMADGDKRPTISDGKL